MDEADIAWEFEQRNISHAIAMQRKASSPQVATGTCLNCGQEDIGQKLFCDDDCKQDWEYAQRIRSKVGASRTPAAAVVN